MGSFEDFDPYDDRARHVDHDVMAELRTGCPVARLSSGYLYLARHEDVARALRDGGARVKAYSHAGKNRADGVVVPEDEQLLAEMEGPRHTRLRRLLQTALHPRLVAGAEPYVRALCNDLLDRIFAVEGEVDLVEAYAIPIPCKVLAHVLGLPEEDHERFRRWSDEVLAGTYPALNRTERGDGLHGGHPEFAAYIDAISEDRARNPRDDLFTRLVETEVDGERLSTTERRVLIALLLIAGNETTSNLIANALHRLAEDPDAARRLRDDPSLVPTAVEESLRLDPPTLMQGRRTVAATMTAGGEPIAAGERVVLGLASANRDERVFEEPDRFRVDRPNADEHVSFGGGAHFCPGAPLARLEARVAVAVFLERVDELRLTPGFRWEKWPVHWANGPSSLPVRVAAVTPGSGAG